MFILGNILIGLGQVLWYFFQFYIIVIVGRAIVSWVSADPRNGIVRFLVQMTDPPMRVIRHMLPQSLRYFPIAQPQEEPELHHLGLPRILSRELVQSLMNCQHPFIALRGG